MSAKNTPATTTTVQSPIQVAETALRSMARYKITPEPENYAVWYTYEHGRNPELAQEVRAMIAAGLPFSAERCQYLYRKYIVGGEAQQAVNEAVINVNRMLTEVLRVVNEFQGETSTYSSNVDAYVHKMEDAAKHPEIAAVVKELIKATLSMKEDSLSLNRKLEASQQEIARLKGNLDHVALETQRDFLTGVSNRQFFESRLEEIMDSPERNAQPLSLLLIDIDHFKKFNDKFGHLIGDEVLKIVARALTDCVKGKDVVARYGGEEFAVLLPDTPLHGAMIVAETVRRTIASRELKRKDTGEVYGRITVSIGVAQLRVDDERDRFIKRADEALYTSKNQGRNRVTSE